jgi:hypothetical protein
VEIVDILISAVDVEDPFDVLWGFVVDKLISAVDAEDLLDVVWGRFVEVVDMLISDVDADDPLDVLWGWFVEVVDMSFVAPRELDGVLEALNGELTMLFVVVTAFKI